VEEITLLDMYEEKCVSFVPDSAFESRCYLLFCCLPSHVRSGMVVGGSERNAEDM
jgi:hypothetical protein